MHRKKIMRIVAFLVVVCLSSIVLIAVFDVNSSVPLSQMNYIAQSPVTPRADGQLCEAVSSENLLTWEQILASSPPITSGVGSGILHDGISGGTWIGNYTFQIPVNTSLTANYHIWYPSSDINSQPLSLRYLVLLNEQQVYGALGEPTDPYYDITLQPGENRTLSIIIPPLKNGLHDLVIVGIANVNEEPPTTGFATTNFGRVTLVVGDDINLASRPYVPLASLANNAFLPGIILNMGFSTEEIKIWDWPDMSVSTQPDTPFTFYIQAGYDAAINTTNEQTSNLPFPEEILSAFVMFINYQQVAINADPVLYALLNSNTNVASVATTIQTPSELGRHDIVVIRINYPGIAMCILSGTEDGVLFPFPVYTWRVAIDNQ